MKEIKVTEYVRNNVRELIVDMPTDPVAAGEPVKFVMPDRIINTVAVATNCGYPGHCEGCVFCQEVRVRCPSYMLDDGIYNLLCHDRGCNDIIFKPLENLMEDI